MTVRSAMELLSAAYSVHPGFAEANIRQHISQRRPAFSDNQPKILHSKHVIQVNGLYRHGFLIAPVVLKQIESVVYLKLKAKTQSTHSQENFPKDIDALPYSHWIQLHAINTNIMEAQL